MKATYYRPNTRVVIELPDDPHTGHRGIVDSTRNVAGDMEHRVRFSDGASAVYYADELLGAEGTPSPQQGYGCFAKRCPPRVDATEKPCDQTKE